MKVERTWDAPLVRAIMLTPGIWERVAEDGQDPATFSPDMQRSCWLLILNDEDTIVGICQVNKLNAVTYDIHPAVLPAQRKVYSRATCRAALTWILENVPQAQKIIAQVPALYPLVKNTACRLGFTVEGINRASYLKNGTIHDQWMLGLKRGEYKWAA